MVWDEAKRSVIHFPLSIQAAFPVDPSYLSPMLLAVKYNFITLFLRLKHSSFRAWPRVRECSPLHNTLFCLSGFVECPDGFHSSICPLPLLASIKRINSVQHKKVILIPQTSGGTTCEPPSSLLSQRSLWKGKLNKHGIWNVKGIKCTCRSFTHARIVHSLFTTFLSLQIKVFLLMRPSADSIIIIVLIY